MRFLHIADLHLGYEQYSSPERFNDFSKAFLWLVDVANDQNVDFVLIAGDTFHKRTVDPLAVRVAIEGLRRLQCPVYGIEGNHEKAYFTDSKSWIDFLNDENAMTVLNGNCVNHGDSVRICGVRYAGAQTNTVVREFVLQLEDSNKFTILMVHAGVEGQVPHTSGLDEDTLSAIHDRVDYLALGHFHKPYTTDGWIFNPGSIENCGAEETLWPRRGGLLVDVGASGNIEHEFIATPKRPFYRIALDVTGAESANDVIRAVGSILEAGSIDTNAVIDFILSGLVQFDRSDIDIKAMRSMFESACSPLVVNIRNETTPVGFSLYKDRSTNDRRAIEYGVIRQIIERNAEYRDIADDLAKAAIEIKRMALFDGPEGVIEYVEDVADAITKPSS